MGRISEGKKMKGVDKNRYKVLGPKKNQTNIFSRWKKCIKNVQIRLAEEQNNLLNLQIQKEWALEYWRIHHSQLKRQYLYFQKKATSSKQRKSEISHIRKYQQ